MPHRHFGKHIPKIRGQRQVAAFIKLILTEAGPTPVDPSALYGTAEREHDGGVTVIRAAIAVLPRRAAKLRHAEHQHLGHAIAQILVERDQSIAKLPEAVGQLSFHGAFIHVMIPAANLSERNLEPNIGLDQLRYLLETPA